MADISKITLPNGTTYDIKDAVARAAMGAGSMTIVWSKSQFDGSTAPTTAQKGQIPDAAYAYYNSGSASTSGTLVAANASVNQFYLVAGYATDPSGNTKGGDYYDEWVVVNESGTPKWEKLGDTQFTGDVTTASAQFIQSLTSGAHHHTYDKTTGVTINTGQTSGTTVATGTLSTNAAVALASSSSSTTGSIPFITSVSAAGATHKHTVTVADKSIKGTASGTAVGASYSYLSISSSGGGISGTASAAFAKSINTASGTVSAASSNFVSSIGVSSANLVTTSIYPAKSISTSSFVTSGTSTRFGTGNALTSVSGTVTAVASRSSSTVATGAITADNTNGTVLTGASFANTVKVATATVQKTVINGENQPTGTNTGTGIVKLNTTVTNETLVFSWASAENIQAVSTMSTPTISVTKGKPATTTVYSANSPESISVDVSSSATSFIKSSTVNSGGQTIITAVSKTATDIDVRDTSVTVATGTVNSEGTGSSVICEVSPSSASALTGLSGTTTFLTTASVNSSGYAITGVGTYTSPTVSLVAGASAEDKVRVVYSASISTQPTISLSEGTGIGSVTVGSNGAATVGTPDGTTSGTTRYLTTSVSQQPVLATTKITLTPTHTSTDTGDATTITSAGTKAYAVTSVALS